MVRNRYLQKLFLRLGQFSRRVARQVADTGCNIELTVIDAGSDAEPWITFGFEAFGPSGRVMAFLGEAVEYFFALHGLAPVRLDGRDSLSYPAWLAMAR